ncbi:hypothetical protein Mapa_008414 [Marchantia paleacea]|nr:hypothetical protein Mapa_008414 [Marchantia paleacea]
MTWNAYICRNMLWTYVAGFQVADYYAIDFHSGHCFLQLVLPGPTDRSSLR